MSVAGGNSNSPPPPPPNFLKLAGLSKVEVERDPTKPLIGVAENSNLGIFIYLVNKQDIHEELSRAKFEVKENEVAIIYDAIIPHLLDRLEQDEISSTYPFRAILVYTMDNKNKHEQEVAHTMCTHRIYGITQFISCSNCDELLSVNINFPNIPTINDDGLCTNCLSSEGL